MNDNLPTKRSSTDRPAEKFDAYQAVTDAICQALEAGTVPWRKPWTTAGTLPLSMSTGKPYRGVNVLLLALAGAPYASPWWGTYKQINERGGQVRKGERSTLVTFWKKLRITDEVDGQPVRRDTFMLRYYRVFNSGQADWPQGSKRPVDPTPRARTEHELVAEADAVVSGYVCGPNGPALHVKVSDQAFYVPALDSITVPEVGQYASVSEYYSTVFHELGHSTGHSTRLDRPSHGHFGDRLYSKEELVAELSAAFLCAQVGVAMPQTLANSAAYIGSWLRVLRADKKLVVQAAAQAQRAAELVLGVRHEQEAAVAA